MSDEIPVGSPPAPHGRHAAPGGWYADPVDPARERYWDGWQWTRNLRPGPGAPVAGPGGYPANAPGVYPPQNYGPAYGAPGMPGQAYGAYRMLPSTADGVPLAAWGWRAVAFLVDYFLLYAVTQLIAAITPLGAAVRRATNAYQAYLTEVLTTGADLDFLHAISLLNTREQMILNVISVVLFIVYSGVMLRSRGATLGKMLFRLRVVPTDQGQSAPGLEARKAWLRPAVTQVFSALAVVSLIDYLFPLWDRRRQTLHDKVATTQVVREVRR